MLIDSRLKCAVDCRELAAENKRLVKENERLQAEVARLADLATAHAPPEQVSYYELQTCGLCGGSGKASAEITLLRCTLCRGVGKVLTPAIGPPIGLSATSDTKEPSPRLSPNAS